MRIFALFISAFAVPISAHAQPAVTVTTGIKTENHRPNGGIVISDNPVSVFSAQVTDESGIFGKVWSTAGAREDTEVRVSAGIVRPCLGGLTCRAELGYWATPDIGRTEGDVIAFTAEVSRSRRAGRGSLGFSTQVEHLAVSGRSDTQIFRIDGNYTHPFGRIPVRIQVGYAHNRRPGWSHIPASVSASVPLSRRVTFTPSIELLVPLNHRGMRQDGMAFGATITIR